MKIVKNVIVGRDKKHIFAAIEGVAEGYTKPIYEEDEKGYVNWTLVLSSEKKAEEIAELIRQIYRG